MGVRERSRRFRGTLFVTRREQHESLTVAVTRLPEGRPDGPSFVLVHGIGVSSRYWRPVAMRLARHGSVYLVDLPGYGSAPDPRTHVSLDDHADVLATFVRTSGLTDVVLVGHSMGAQVVASAAQRHPELAGHLVLMAPTIEPSRRNAWRAIGRLLLDGFREPPVVTWLAVTDYLLRCGVPYIVQQFPVLLDDALEERIADVPGRLLLMRGENDVVVSREWTRMLAERAGAPFAEVRGPHNVMYTDPDTVTERIVQHAVVGAG